MGFGVGKVCKGQLLIRSSIILLLLSVLGGCARLDPGAGLPIGMFMGASSGAGSGCIRLTVDSALVNADLANFPLLVHVPAGTMAGSIRADGFDITFLDSDGVTELDHEIESIDASTGELTAWVRLPSLSASLNTELFVRYGDGGATDDSNAAGVWTNGYRALWHLNQSVGGTGAVKDSLSSGFDGTDKNGALLGAVGKIGTALELDGVDDYVELGTDNIIKGLTSFTFSAWVYLDSTPGANSEFVIWDRRQTSEQNGVGFIIGDYASAGDTRLKVANNDTGAWSDFLHTDQISQNNWNFVAAVYNGTNIKFYLNGGTPVSRTYVLPGNENNLMQTIGRTGEIAGGHFNGKIDELRISSRNRSTNWLQATYNNQNDPSSFYSQTSGVGCSF